MKTKNRTNPKRELWSGRPVKERKTFYEKGTFNSMYRAKEWLSENGYSYGSTARDLPIGLMKGDFEISKWYNLDDSDIKELDGVMISNDFREGAVELLFFN